MTVEELIKALERFPQHMTVTVCMLDSGLDVRDIASIEGTHYIESKNNGTGYFYLPEAEEIECIDTIIDYNHVITLFGESD